MCFLVYLSHIHFSVTGNGIRLFLCAVVGTDTTFREIAIEWYITLTYSAL